MVVDDDYANVILAVEVLRMFGDAPVATSSSADALEVYQRGNVDLVLMDVHMPGMDGLELTSRIRGLERQSGARRTPIIALTASAMPHELKACFEHGMDDVMTKPFDFATMISMIDRWCPRPI